ncbi:hypothetical protein LTR08_006981 [Meristemomyces frigidus]|nr:hypothetical protein LTR08_006981 [Meristemomyces frigidus]
MEDDKTARGEASSLSNMRPTSSEAEGTLREKETRIAHLESIHQQLQARIQKAMDREQSNESYLRDLETEMEGTTNGEEKKASLIVELRRELARVRETENSAEDYIATLEERLTETAQDQESMQREIDRLEHVVERQRSIGRLDNLLGELDGVRGSTLHTSAPPVQPVQAEDVHVNGHHAPQRESYDPFRPAPMAGSSGNSGDAEPERNVLSGPFADEYEQRLPSNSAHGEEDGVERPTTAGTLRAPKGVNGVYSPDRTGFTADKVESIRQDLFDLRSEHEINLNDYNKLQQKYQTALETLAILENEKGTPKSSESPIPSRPTTSSTDAGMRGEERERVGMRGQPSSSWTLSAEPGHSITTGDKDEEKAQRDLGIDGIGMADGFDIEDEVDPATIPLPEDLHEEIEILRQMHAEKEISVAELTNDYKSLAQRHESTLAQVEDLKQEVYRAHNALRPASPGFNKPVFRRGSHDILHASNDRTSRSFASLKNIALDHFESNPDTRQNFELNLSTVMTELHGRTERAHSLEAELGTVRRELEGKQTIIAGLTRERSTLAASSGVDFSVVGQMRDQLMESEHQIRLLHEQNAEREKEFQGQINGLKASLTEHQKSASAYGNAQLPTPVLDHFSHVPGDYPETPDLESTLNRELGGGQAMAGAESAEMGGGQGDDVARLRSELTAWETRHHNAIESMKASEAKLLSTIADLESSMREAETAASSVPSNEATTAAASFEAERVTHHQVVETLQRQVDEYQSASTSHVTKLKQLEQSHANILRQVDEDSASRDLAQKELKQHQDLVSNLESQLQVHKSAITMHQETLESLQASHSRDMEELNTAMTAAERDSKDSHAALEEHHSLVLQVLEADLASAQDQVAHLLRSASSALGYEADPTQLHSHIRGLVDEGKELHSRHLKTTNDLKSVQEELQNALNNSVSYENKIGELKMKNEEALLNLQKLNEKERRSARLVEELEDQLNNNFDSHQQATHRLSTMQSETVHVRQELERELEDHKLRNGLLEQQISMLNRQSVTSTSSAINFNRESLSPEAAAIALARSGSQASTGKKSGGPTTAPPSIPLPPLPGTPGSSQITATPPMPNILERERATSPVQRATSPNTSVSPPGSRHASKDVSPNMSQLVEDQEARIRTIEKHLFAEKQLTATLEEALVDLETSANRTKSEMDNWRKKCTSLEDEMVGLRKDRTSSRASLQAVEEEREMRLRAERARQALEQRMMELNATKKKKKNALNCF